MERVMTRRGGCADSNRRVNRSASAALLVGLVAAAMVGPTGSQRVAAAGANWYVAPNGSATNDGSQSRPLDLATALSSRSPATPGDTIWLRGGVYRGNFTSVLNGVAGLPIVVRQYPGERATIDGSVTPTAAALSVKGSYTWFWGFEVMNSYPDRASGPTSRGPGIAQTGAFTKLINLVVHDALDGIQTWAGVTDGEVYGNVIYNNGADGSDRGHGHSMYVQNSTGTKRIVDNVMLNSYSFGVHAYTESGAIDNIWLEGNIAYNHGVLAAVCCAKANYLIGGSQIAQNSTLLTNYGYYPMGSPGRNGDIGYETVCNAPTLRNNYFAGGTSLKLNCLNETVTGNSFYGAFASTMPAAYPSNTFSTARPTGVKVVVRPNAYEAGRANVAIYNWALQSSVSVDLSTSGLRAGDTFEIRDAQNFYGTPVLTGTYTGAAVAVRMTGLTAAQPIGSGRTPASSGPEFGAFVVLRTSGAVVSPAPTASLAVSPVSVTAGQSATLSWTTTNATSVSISPSVGAVAAAGSVAVAPSQTTTYTLTASGAGGTTTSAATITVTPAGGGIATSGSATFLTTDTATQGSWITRYGADGFRTAADTTRDPSYARVTFGGALNWTWAGSTTDVRALQNASGAGRLAATWYESVFTIDVDVLDGAQHQLALYAIDWDGQSRTQTIELLDRSTGALLDRRSLSSFNSGVYYAWRVGGSVRVRVTRTGGSNAVISGLFFGATSATPPALPPPPPPPPPTAPTASLSATPTSLTAGQSATLSWNTSNAASVSISPGVGAVAASGSIGVSPSQTTMYTLTASGAGGTATSTANVAVTAGTPATGTTATFLGADVASQGTWINRYGADGVRLAGDGVRDPVYARVTFANAFDWTWAASTADPRALQRASGAGRLAATWYETSSSFSIDVDILDGSSHQLALYLLDWDVLNRGETIEVSDRTTGAVLDRRPLSAFYNGVYLVWRVSGSIRVKVIRNAGANAVVSGIFFDR